VGMGWAQRRPEDRARRGHSAFGMARLARRSFQLDPVGPRGYTTTPAANNREVIRRAFRKADMVASS
jgi:hypothetical protein